MKKNLLVFGLLLCGKILFAQTPVNLNVGILNGPSCIPVSYLMENKNTDLQISYQKFADPQALLPKLIKKEIDIGFMPVNVAAKVYNSSNKSIICAAICGNGNLCVITKNPKIKKFSDLKNKTIYIAGQGATPEYITEFLISKNGLEDDINLDFSIPTANIAANLISDKIEYAIVPEPFATIAVSKDKSIIYAVDLQKEYYQLTGYDSYPLTCIVVRNAFAKENPEIVQAFLNEYKKALEWTNKNPDMAGEYCEKNDLGLSKYVVSKSIPKSNYVYTNAKDAKKEIEQMLSIFMKFNSSAVGNNLPDDDFYLK